METVFHFGKESDKFLHDFEERRAERVLQDITGWSVDELKALLYSLREENRTFAAARA